jgi:hypothetical protein
MTSKPRRGSESTRVTSRSMRTPSGSLPVRGTRRCPHKETTATIAYRDGGTWVDFLCDECHRVVDSQPSRFSPKAWADYYGTLMPMPGVVTR